MTLKISIITPSYNQAEFLEETITSVIRQNYTALEYIIIDGGSTDKSVEIIKQYEKHLNYWVSEKDAGQSAAINKGFQKASGDIVAWLNSDDLYCEKAFQTVAEIFEKNKEVDIVYGHVINFDAQGKEELIQNKFEIKDFFSRISLHQPAIFWRRSLLNEIGLLDEDLTYCMDYDLWMALFLNYNSIALNTVLARFRVHPKSKTGNGPINMYDEYQSIVSKFFYSLPGEYWKNKLSRSGVNHIQTEKKYHFNKEFSVDLLHTLFQVYVLQSLEIEYTKGKLMKVNQLFLLNPFLFSTKKGILIFLKSNSLYLYLRPKIRR